MILKDFHILVRLLHSSYRHSNNQHEENITRKTLYGTHDFEVLKHKITPNF